MTKLYRQACGYWHNGVGKPMAIEHNSVRQACGYGHNGEGKPVDIDTMV
jgi:hypothetical protein